MKLIYKLGAIVTVSLFALVLFAGNTYAARCVIRNNGNDSTNRCRIYVDKSTYIRQSNHAGIFNFVNAESETGENDANNNTGGSVTLTSGNATTTVVITNTVNQNNPTP